MSLIFLVFVNKELNNFIFDFEGKKVWFTVFLATCVLYVFLWTQAVFFMSVL